MHKVIVTTSSFAKYDDEPLNLLKQRGFEVLLNPYGRKLKRHEIIPLCKGIPLIIAGTELFDACTLEDLPGLKIISRCGAGLENIDLDTAERLKIRVFNTPDAPALAVAELTICLMLALLRKVRQMDACIRAGRWEKAMGNLLCGKKVGVVGFGRVGRKVAELLRPFGCAVSYADPLIGDNLMGLKRLPLDELLGWSDIVSIHASGRNRIIGSKEIKMIKKGGWLINTSRGGAVDESALCKALRQERLSGAALDVFEKEPYVGPLKKSDNVILTSHAGSYAREARVKMELKAARNLLKGLAKND